MVDFADKLAALVAAQTAKANPDDMGEVIERLISSASFTIAIAARGDPETMNNLLEGASQYMFEEAADKAKFARFMHGRLKQ